MGGEALAAAHERDVGGPGAPVVAALRPKPPQLAGEARRGRSLQRVDLPSLRGGRDGEAHVRLDGENAPLEVPGTFFVCRELPPPEAVSNLVARRRAAAAAFPCCCYPVAFGDDGGEAWTGREAQEDRDVPGRRRLVAAQVDNDAPFDAVRAKGRPYDIVPGPC